MSAPSRAAPRREARMAPGRRRRCVRPAPRRPPSRVARPGTSAPNLRATSRRTAGSPSPQRGRGRGSRARGRGDCRCEQPSPRGSPSPARRLSHRVPRRRHGRRRRAPTPRLSGCRGCRPRSCVRRRGERTRSRPPGGRDTSRRTGPPGAARERDRVSRCWSCQALAGAFASISAASAMSFSASSRLPSASSFFTSFSTARRLYD